VFPLIVLASLYGMCSYTRDPIGETSACSSLLSLVYGIRTRTLISCREVFPSGGSRVGIRF
jgi:hypothetical protein